MGRQNVQSLNREYLTGIFHTSIGTTTLRRVRARSLQHFCSLVVGRVPSRGDSECERCRLGVRTLIASPNAAVTNPKRHLQKYDFVIQSNAMESNWAAEHLQVIRTLMERSALYRRALAPIMIYIGLIGSIAAIIGLSWWRTYQPPAFILFWGSVAAVAMAGSFFLVRRQALKAGEPFWSPPTRRVTQATLPPFAFGLFIGVAAFVSYNRSLTYVALDVPIWLPISWVVLYGCAFHAAGFFMPRGMRVFGWAFVIAGCAIATLCLFTEVAKSIPARTFANGVMGLFFGVLHLAYGVYLYFTEQRRDET